MTKSESHQGVDRALRVLTLLGDNAAGMSLGEIAVATGISKSTMHRVLSAMKSRDFVHQDGPSSRYMLGPAALEVAFRFQAESPIVASFHDQLVQVSRWSGLTVHLARLMDTSVVYLDKVNPIDGLRTNSVIGGVNPAHVTGVGKALLAATLDEKDDRLLKGSRALEARTEHSITNLAELAYELELTRERGFAVDREESEVGVMCVAVAVEVVTGEFLGLSATGPSPQVIAIGIENLGSALLSAGMAAPYSRPAGRER
ncbi:IclR family transcriptional regulator [Ruania alkalisoli]|uniref:Glycerol operon regulatory protein n=1 Tax=Ruania alkalisoli TaxID=2779775 RepID=A0A7M1SUR4_9MICO|nr:IclR family transcriptional regulator [Ruania alkalisoli]QOR70807.1 IclR family transcriptional regulator [Ruania alkalisoli]